MLSFGLSLNLSCLIKAIGGVPSPKREYNSRVIPVAFLIAGSRTGLVFFFFCIGAVFEMERTSRISALVILECFEVGDVASRGNLTWLQLKCTDFYAKDAPTIKY